MMKVERIPKFLLLDFREIVSQHPRKGRGRTSLQAPFSANLSLLVQDE